ncbi:MAG: VOC family protein [Gammaproteobacteria bacterium]|nr:VOC family protein [Gammaproteobacteria bacterium]
MNNILKRTTLIVRDMDVSLRWYREVLGLSVYYDKPVTLVAGGIAAGKPGDMTRLVILKGDHPEIGMIGLLQWIDPPLPAPKDIPTGVTYGNPTFVVSSDDSAEAHRRAVMLGTRVHAAPCEWSVEGADGSTKYFLGTSLFDPDGYFYEFNQLLRTE